MSQERHDAEYGDQKLLRVSVLIVALMGVGLCIAPQLGASAGMTPGLWILIALWMLILVGGGIWVGRVQSEYRCRLCGRRLAMLPTQAATKYQHRFHCPTCDVVWTTDVYDSD